VLETFRALADPSRLQIIDLLLREPLPVGTIAERLCIRQPQASKHLRALGDAGLVEVRPDAQRRIYALRAQPFQEIDGWLERYRGVFEEQFERLDQVLEELQASKKPIEEKTKPTRGPRRVVARKRTS
jgi:DNA-binding transcriptional ArsR family regulator